MSLGGRLGPSFAIAALALLGDGGAEARLRPVEGVLPANGQVVLPDLSDEGLDGAISVQVRVPLARRRHLRYQYGMERTSAVSLLRHDFAAVPHEVRYRPGAGFLTVAPGLPLADGQYTLALESRLLGKPGPLDVDFRTSFTVGPDVYPPRILSTEPAANQAVVPPFARIRVAFNESLDPATLVLGETVLVEDVGVDPPRPIGGVVVLRGDDFVLEFVPDPCIGYPPATTVRLRVLGGSHEAAVRDVVGNALEDDLLLGFATAGDAALPDPALVPPPSGAFYATTADSVVAFDVRDALDEDGTVHLDRIRQVTTANGYGGEFRARLGRPGDAVVDPRSHPDTGHSILYVVDGEAKDVLPIETSSGRVGAGLGGFRDPAGLGITLQVNDSDSVDLFVTDARDRSLTLVPIGGPMGGPLCAGPVFGSPGGRAKVMTQGVPGAVAAASNVVGSAVNLALPAQNETALYACRDGVFTERGRVAVGEGPSGLAWSDPSADVDDLICWVVGVGGPLGTGGFVSIETDFMGAILWWFDNYFSVIATVKESREPGSPCALPGTSKCLVPDRATASLFEMEKVVVGSGLGATIRIRVNRRIDVGEVPSSVATDPSGRLAFVALVGEGKIAVIDLEDPDPVVFKIPLPGVRSVFSTTTQ